MIGHAKARPVHRSTLHIPGRARHVAEVFPVGRAPDVWGYCKYCYRTHNEWWAMPEHEYPNEVEGEPTRALLCGFCEHVSLECFT